MSRKYYSAPIKPICMHKHQSCIFCRYQVETKYVHFYRKNTLVKHYTSYMYMMYTIQWQVVQKLNFQDGHLGFDLNKLKSNILHNWKPIKIGLIYHHIRAFNSKENHVRLTTQNDTFTLTAKVGLQDCFQLFIPRECSYVIWNRKWKIV